EVRPAAPRAARASCRKGVGAMAWPAREALSTQGAHSPRTFLDRLDELAHRTDLFDLGEIELNAELALDAAHQPDMRQAVPGLEILLAGFGPDQQTFIVEFGAEHVLKPGHYGVR